MRYQNWDALVFPDECKIPLQEFKTSCQVIQDPELHHLQASPFLLPTVTSFIPGLSAGAPFRISIHSWQNPEISRHIQALRKPSERVLFEARLFIDGRISGTKWFHDDGPWPTVIELSIDLDKRGDFEKLKFPTFHKELLSQSYWNAGDDLGRIKLVIAEGFARDNLTYPFERVKNVVSFSFQHAPLDVLETSSIAWPNATMWRQVSLLAPFYTQHSSPRQEPEALEAHGHSPRKLSLAPGNILPTSSLPSMPPPNHPTFRGQQLTNDPFTEPHRQEFKKWRQPSDTSMADYSSAQTRSSGSRLASDPVVIGEKSDRRFETMQSAGAYDSLCDALNNPAISPPAPPVNTPHNPADISVAVVETQVATITAALVATTGVDTDEATDSPSTFAIPVQHKIQGRKENLSSPNIGLNQGSNEGVSRKVSQTFAASNSGHKRQRIVTPAASKVIDAEDEPRASPSSRKVSRTDGKDTPEGERRILSGIQNV